MTKHKKRGRLLIHIPGVWPNPSEKTSNVHAYRERLHVLLGLLLRPNFGMSIKQQTLYINPQCHTGPPLRFVCQCSNAKIQRSEHNTKQIREKLMKMALKMGQKTYVVHKICVLDAILSQKFDEFLHICVIIVTFVARQKNIVKKICV